jgi:hypothetical protein
MLLTLAPELAPANIEEYSSSLIFQSTDIEIPLLLLAGQFRSIADCGLRIADCGLRIADIADCGLRI